MNAIVTLDSILEPSQALTPAALFGTGQIETIVSAIESQVRAEVYDVGTAEGRERIKSVAYKIARSKTTLDEIGKEHVADIKAKSAAIDKERKTLRDRLDALKDAVRKPVTDWEAAEANRVNEHERLLVDIIESVRFASTVPSVNLIEQRLSAVKDIYNRDWQEFQARAEGAAFEANAALETMLVAAKKAEAERVELEALRAEAEALRAEKAAREAAEAEERRLAEQRAAAEREAAAAIEREKARAEQAKRDQEAAVARAIEQERQRAEQARIEAEQRAEREKLAAIEADRRKAEEETRRVAAAAEAERRRQEQEARDAAAKKAAEEAAERKRQENKRHRERIYRNIMIDLAEALCAGGKPTGEENDMFSQIVDLIAEGKIRNVSIQY
ncbi:hypothetical protein [Bradyrhizobium ivorense]|uniref:hypothetical protein n=1 Tax=Bradyrhizobium ivorense TaxID=2511166 RepID=UPI0010B1834D|nr:hypothetical protein [Bradyrhizobium ivorense]VIO73849.1 hypothetical protein CI41S_39580 [Bradyrhizobium ivorense]